MNFYRSQIWGIMVRLLHVTLFALLAITVTVVPTATAHAATVKITSKPKGFTKSSSATFAWTTSPAGAATQCSLNGQPFRSCSRKVTYRNLRQARHAFRVRVRKSPTSSQWYVARASWYVDYTKPQPGTISYATAPTSAPSLPVTFALGSDAHSGILMRRMTFRRAPLMGGVCAKGYDSYSGLPVSNPVSPYSMPLLNASCYQFRTWALDRAGNWSERVGGKVMVDRTAPTVEIGPLIGVQSVATTVQGTAVDAHTSVAEVTVVWWRTFGGYPLAGEACATSAVGAGGIWSCNWDLTSLSDGHHTIKATAVDATGNVAYHERTGIVVDNTRVFYDAGEGLTVAAGSAGVPISIVLSSAPTANVRVWFSSSTVEPIDDVIFTPDNWATPQVVTVRAASDLAPGTSEGFVLAYVSSEDGRFNSQSNTFDVAITGA